MAMATFGCEICMDDFREDIQKRVCAIFCGHVFHENCLKLWFRTQVQRFRPTTCPKCRTLAGSNEMIRLFMYDTGSSATNTQQLPRLDDAASLPVNTPVSAPAANTNTDIDAADIEAIEISDSDTNSTHSDQLILVDLVSDSDDDNTVPVERPRRPPAVPRFNYNRNIIALQEHQRRMQVLQQTLTDMGARLDNLLSHPRPHQIRHNI